MLSAVSFAAESSVETNVVFATYSGLALLMDVYKPATSNGLGIVVINGSGWYRDLGYDANLLKQSQEFRPATQKLVTAGYTVFVITHRASPRFHVPDIIEDVQRATRFIAFAPIALARSADHPAAISSACWERSTARAIPPRLIRSNGRARRFNASWPSTLPLTWRRSIREKVPLQSRSLRASGLLRPTPPHPRWPSNSTSKHPRSRM
ncbi:MAG: hypothetical protein DMF98_10545 [Acidobacteria bacterium]|nr:MAG: hypothetical protein DMF98_10545 [Acidobacteriota bacterium]